MLLGMLLGGLVGVVIVALLFNPLSRPGTTPYERYTLVKWLVWAAVGWGVIQIGRALL